MSREEAERSALRTAIAAAASEPPLHGHRSPADVLRERLAAKVARSSERSFDERQRPIARSPQERTNKEAPPRNHRTDDGPPERGLQSGEVSPDVLQNVLHGVDHDDLTV